MIDMTKIRTEIFQRIPFDKFEKDFSFIVNGQIYTTNSFVANILSPNISKKFDENMKTSYFEINTEYNGDFNRIIEFGEMKTIDIKQEEKPYFENVLIQLGNADEAIQFNQIFQEDISIENVFQRIQIKKELGVNLEKEIAFISSNFNDFYTKFPNAILTFDLDIVEQIISNNQFKISDEDELFDIILQLYNKSKEYSILFSYVVFMNLSLESIKTFHQIFDISDMNKSIWERICDRLEQDISNKSKEAFMQSQQEFLINRYFYQRYDHIIQHLNEQCNGNVHTQNIVHITSSELLAGYVENIVEQATDKFIRTKNIAGSWIQFDFKKRKVFLDGYTLQTVERDSNHEHLRSWVLEVSNDGQNYTEIDRQEDSNLLNGPLQRATFKVSSSIPQRFVRLTQTSQNWYNDNELWLNQIDFSGILYE